MSKAISLTIETQTEDLVAIVICHVNQQMLALDNSLIADKMLKLNRPLFEKINKSTKIIGGDLYRQEVIQAKGNTNSVYVSVDNKHEYREEKIAELVFENNRLVTQNRMISKYNKKFDYKPVSVSDKNTGGFFHPKKPSPSDIESSQFVSTVQEIGLFQDMGIKSFLFRDNLRLKKSLVEAGYRIQLVIKTDFKEYIDYVIKQSEDSILFLSTYLDSLNYPSNYNKEKMLFNEKYANRTLASLGLSPNMGLANLNTDRIKNSDYGKAAIAYYNATSLLSANVDKKIYSKIMNTILPTNKTTPGAINSFIRNFNSILESVRFEYLGKTKKQEPGTKRSMGNLGSVVTNIVESSSNERLKIERENLGYCIFSDSPNLNVYSPSDYTSRWRLEQSKHYPNLNIADASSFLSEDELKDFLNIDNAPGFLTPLALVLGDRKIRTNRGMNNINIGEVRQFRLSKSSRYERKRREKFSYESNKEISYDALSSLNVTVGPAVTALLDRSTSEDVDMLLDAKHYVGSGVSFSTNDPSSLIKQLKRVQTKEDERALSIASDIIPDKFLKNDRSINSTKEVQFSNPNSLVRKLVTDGGLKLELIPPHIKFMMSKGFNPSPTSDPLKNPEARQIIAETQKNLFVIRALVSFRRDQMGFLNVHAPIYKQMNKRIVRSQRPLLAKAFDYEEPQLGIVKDNFLATIYNNLVYITT